MPGLKEIHLRQLDDVLDLYGKLDVGVRTISTTTYARLSSAALGVINRVAGPDSIYIEQAREFKEFSVDESFRVNYLIGIVRTLRDDVAAGYLDSVKEIIHGEMFGDFLDMSDFLLREGYKDAAAVMGGGVLESHLRQLCIKHKIDIEIAVNPDARPKKADQLNSELVRNKVYNILEQKNVTAWLDLRNKAAHAKYGEYTKEHVSLMLQGLRDFIARYPA